MSFKYLLCDPILTYKISRFAQNSHKLNEIKETLSFKDSVSLSTFFLLNKVLNCSSFSVCFIEVYFQAKSYFVH